MNRYLLLLLTTVSLGACTTTYFQHPTKTDDEWSADYSACEAQAGQAAAYNDKYGVVRNRVLENCLHGKGWQKQ